MTVQPVGGGVSNRPSGTSLADVIDTILDKGIVIDAYASVSLIGIELLSVDARIVVASVDTYLRFAEATDRLDLAKSRKPGLPEVVETVTQTRGAETTAEAERLEAGGARGSLEAAGERLRGFAGDFGEREDERESERVEVREHVRPRKAGQEEG
ncbi:putative gas vesicle structural protein 1 [Acrocarpospora phusangensis]|uniref:Gas vesicle protein A n=1 Tax=Acrocarpospora phusangensis TaxID=1070424 RepID=A0A919UMU4_9ACTN|nr:gas vesicle protein GvpJ [Acrocarpospora phusangensis]GIH27736.1 putative gas vesicle structural protein 1 [Acrocarpospora phusangensis]